MVFDGDCNFCKLWIRRWHCLTGEKVDYLPFQDPAIAIRFPEVPRQQFEKAVQLIEPGGAVYRGAEAVFRALAYHPNGHWLLDWYRHSTIFARATESAYRFVAGHRPFFSFLTRLGWGRHVEPPTHFLVRGLFLRSLALIYLAAFVSLWLQLPGLIGSQGILPAKLTMAAARKNVEAANLGVERYHLFPTLCWFNASDRFLQYHCAAGTALAILLLAGIAPAPSLFLMWLIYLSLSTVCREFLSFQWDILLLETGFLAIFFAPLQLFPRTARTVAPSRIVLWLLRLLLFRLMFESGAVKLLSGDPTWRSFTALTFHFETQPLPTWIGWYAHQLPLAFQKTATGVMFFIELAVPFLIFTPRRLRRFGCGALVALQLFILLTGNYCFFNLLTILLCLTLLDDFSLQRLFRLKFAGPATGIQCDGPAPPPAAAPARSRRRWPHAITVPLACLAGALAFMQMSLIFRLGAPWPGPMAAVYEWLSPFRTFNTYGLFAVMTTIRREIIVEGSDDAVRWHEYEFKYKPGNVQRRPEFVAPHQPRLDWQMWFAALGPYQQNPWFVNFCIRLLEGSPDALKLLQRNPFPARPPRYLRAIVYEYHFTDWPTRRRTGAWWRRERKGEYLPVLSRNEN
jgi:predicted DCC family thiol-disulfide oxidoreductase YuxK